jgi:hypothetical protein
MTTGVLLGERARDRRRRHRGRRGVSAARLTRELAGHHIEESS